MRPFSNPVLHLRTFLATAAVLVGAASFAHAATISYSAHLDGATEGTPSPGTGDATAVYDNVAHTLTVHCTFAGLLSNTTASHIHAPTAVAGTGTAGVATTTPTFSGFPLGVMAGTYDKVLDLTLASSYNPAYVTANGGTTAGAEAALAQALADGKSYWNIHTSQFPGGEIRGFLTPTPTPAEVQTWGYIKGFWH